MKIVAYISEWCLKNAPIESKEERVAITYGVQIVVSAVWKFLFLVISATCVGYGKEAVVVLCTFASIRSQANGIHMKSGIACTLNMGVIMGLALGARKFPVVTNVGLAFCLGICSVILYLFAPADFNGYWKRSYEQKQRNKWNAIVITGVVFVVMFVWVKNELRNVMVMSCLLEMMTILPIWGRKRGEKDGSKEENCTGC